jgi:hypothetical protein
MGHSGTAVVDSWPAVHRIAGPSYIGRSLVLPFCDALDVQVLGCRYRLVSQDAGVGFRDDQEARSEKGNGVCPDAWAQRLDVQQVTRRWIRNFRFSTGQCGQCVNMQKSIPTSTDSFM